MSLDQQQPYQPTDRVQNLYTQRFGSVLEVRQNVILGWVCVVRWDADPRRPADQSSVGYSCVIPIPPRRELVRAVSSLPARARATSTPGRPTPAKAGRPPAASPSSLPPCDGIKALPAPSFLEGCDHD